jgi:hypothetical protein
MTNPPQRSGHFTGNVRIISENFRFLEQWEAQCHKPTIWVILGMVYELIGFTMVYHMKSLDFLAHPNKKSPEFVRSFQ